jgi:Fanconi-associated nuclease 1
MGFSSTKDVGDILMLGGENLDLDRDGARPPAKRLKASASTDGEDFRDVSSEEVSLHTPKYHQGEVPDSDAESDIEDASGTLPQQATDLEAASAPIKTDKEAIEAYETMRMVDRDIPEDLKVRLGQRSWAHGKSSIYVDAFNLALETVLEEEHHLFDEKELEIFEQWRGLEYEAQYL